MKKALMMCLGFKPTATGGADDTRAMVAAKQKDCLMEKLGMPKIKL